MNIQPYYPPLPLQDKRGVFNYMSTPNIYGLIRQLCEETGGPYLEIGSYRGQSLLAAGQDTGIEAVGIDNFTEIGWRSENEEILLQQISPFSNISLIKADYATALKELYKEKRKFNVVFVDGPHGPDETHEQIKLSDKLLNKGGYMIVDDLNFTGVALGLDRFLKKAAGKKYKIILEQKTVDRNHPTWWNGICVMQKP